jgi:hypothetical protein
VDRYSLPSFKCNLQEEDRNGKFENKKCQDIKHFGNGEKLLVINGADPGMIASLLVLLQPYHHTR